MITRVPQLIRCTRRNLRNFGKVAGTRFPKALSGSFVSDSASAFDSTVAEFYLQRDNGRRRVVADQLNSPPRSHLQALLAAPRHGVSAATDPAASACMDGIGSSITAAVEQARRQEPQAATLVLLRHAQSEYNRQHRFTGWSDVGLSARGVAEAKAAGELLARSGYLPDQAFTSELRRAQHTCDLVLENIAGKPVPREASWRLNERHYGALEGLGIVAALRRFGPLPLLRCRRELATRPPQVAIDDPRFPGHDARYASLLRDELPRGESYADVLARLEPYLRNRIAPALRPGRTILIVSHKNTIHLLLMLLEHGDLLTARRIPVPTATPIIVEIKGSPASDQGAGLSAQRSDSSGQGTVLSRKILKG